MILKKSVKKEQLKVLEEMATTRKQVKSLAARLSLAEQRERDRVARLLHDDLQQILHSIQMQLHIIQESRDFGEKPFKVLEKEIKEAIETTRNLSTDMSPPILKQEGLIEALHWLKHRFQDRHHFKVSVNVQGVLPAVEPGSRLLLFHITRELLFNVVKHAAIGEAEVCLRTEEGMFALEVHDNGKGFKQSIVENANSVQAGFGLNDVRERVEAFGGRVHLVSNPGDGSSVTILIPMGIAKDEKLSGKLS